ncbi:hypothetical protein NKH18_00965 [Streptomyces sp. M10(2022)]
MFEALNDHRSAATEYGRAATTRPAGTYARIVALDLVAAAEVQLKRGSIEQACATWGAPWTTWMVSGRYAPVEPSPGCAATSPLPCPQRASRQRA